jgi:hypothetical protein
METEGNLTKLLTAALLIALILFLGCVTARPGPEVQETLALLRPPAPEAPEMEPVRFERQDGGLWLSYDNYRALERNVIALREYAERLEIIIGFYQEE